jgi:hypothetical protein
VKSEDVTEDDPTDEYHSWDFFDDLPPEAFIHHYKSIENVPKEHQEEARREVLKMNDKDAVDFISTGETIPIKFTPDIIDAVAIATLEGLADRLADDGEAILEMCESTNVSPISIPPGQLGYKLFQIHTVTTSYAESAAGIILRHHMRIASGWDAEYLIEWASHKDRVGDGLAKIDDFDQKINEIHEWATGSVKRLSLVLKHADIIGDPLYKHLDSVRDRRNNFIHSAATLAINDFSNSDDVRDSVEECLSVVSGLSEELNSVHRHPIYDEFTTEP